MSVETDIAELKNDIEWIKQSLADIKQSISINRSLKYSIGGAILISMSSLIIAVLRVFR